MLAVRFQEPIGSKYPPLWWKSGSRTDLHITNAQPRAFSGLNRVKSCLLPMIFLGSLQQAWGVSPSTSLISERHPPQPLMLWAQSEASLLDRVFCLSWNKQPPVRSIGFSKEDPLSWKPWNDVQNSRGANRNATCYEPYHLPGFPDVIMSLSLPREQFLIQGCFSISRLLALLKQNLISKLCPLPSTLTSTHTTLFPYNYTYTFIHLQRTLTPLFPYKYTHNLILLLQDEHVYYANGKLPWGLSVFP